MRVDDQVGGFFEPQNRQKTSGLKGPINDGSAVFELPPGPLSEPPATSAQNGADSREETAADDAPKTAFEKIVDVGFSQFVADLEEEKLKKLREKILNAMGLSEEMLAEMTHEQRSVIEKMIAEEIKRRIEGGAVMNGAANDKKVVPDHDTGSLKPVGGGMALGQAVNDGSATKGAELSTGLGPLLALQEIKDKEPQTAFRDGLEKVGKKGPYGL